MVHRRSGVAGVVLAAGLSRRFGGNKLLALLHGTPLVRHALKAALASRLDRIVVVLGHQSDRVRAALTGLLDGDRCAVATNHAYRNGQSQSVIAGLEAVGFDCPAVMFLMGDQPLLDAGIIDELIAAHKQKRTDICFPSCNGRRRNPVIFSARFYPHILALKGDTGARAVIDANRDAATAVEFANDAQFQDVDRDHDLDILRGTGG